MHLVVEGRAGEVADLGPGAEAVVLLVAARDVLPHDVVLVLPRPRVHLPVLHLSKFLFSLSIPSIKKG